MQYLQIIDESLHSCTGLLISVPSLSPVAAAPGLTLTSSDDGTLL